MLEVLVGPEINRWPAVQPRNTLIKLTKLIRVLLSTAMITLTRMNSIFGCWKCFHFVLITRAFFRNFLFFITTYNIENNVLEKFGKFEIFEGFLFYSSVKIRDFYGILLVLKEIFGILFLKGTNWIPI